MGRAEPYVAGPPERSPEPVRRVASVTAALPAVAAWFPAGHLETMVMARTGVSGIPLCHSLDARGCAVHVGNARHAQNLPGRNTDIAVWQWRQTRHPFGRLHRSFRPTDAICG